MDRQTAYSFSRALPLAHKEALARVRKALQAEGFGILTEIDVQKILKEKLNQDFRRYVILGTCDPSLAYQALQAEPEIGVLLPCNVVVYEEDGQTVVSAMDPEGAMVLVKNEKVSEVARLARQKLENALESL